MKKIIKYFYVLFFLILQNSFVFANISIGEQNAKVNVKVFSSLTCPHCASFHIKIFDKLKEEYIDNNKVYYEHFSFPLDLAALNAEKIIKCTSNKDIAFKLLDSIYRNQNNWAIGEDINKINNSLINLSVKFNIKKEKLGECLKDKNLQDQILSQRIEAQKNYKISSTPTIFINDKEYDGKHDFKSFKKQIDKNL